MTGIGFQSLLSNVTTDSSIRKVVNINPNKFSQTVLQISDQQSRDKKYQVDLDYIRTYIASLQAKMNSLVEELNTIYENTLTDTLFRRADSKNTAKKLNKLKNYNEGGLDPNSLQAVDNADTTMSKVNITPNHSQTKFFSYNPFFGTRTADLSNYYNLSTDADINVARAYNKNEDNSNHELGASALGALSYLWLWDVDRINASYSTTMDKYVDKNGILHLPTNDPLRSTPPYNDLALYPNGAAYNGIMFDPAMNILGASNNSEKLQVNITSLQPNRGLVDLSGIDAPKAIIPIDNLSSWAGFQFGDIGYTNGSGYNFVPPTGNKLFFDPEKWAIVDVNGVEPKMDVLYKVTKEQPPVDSFGPNYGNGNVPVGGIYGTPAGGWINQSTYGRAIASHAPGLWDYQGPTGQNGVLQVDLSKKITFNGAILDYPTEPSAQYAGFGGGDDGWALYAMDGSTAASTPGISPNGNIYTPSSPWSLVRAVAGPNGINYTNTGLVATQSMDLHVVGNTSGWAGGSNGGAYINGSFGISARTIGDGPGLETITVNRYIVDENGAIIDRFGLDGWNNNYGHGLGSSQLSNPNHVRTNQSANGFDDYNLYDYVPNLLSPGVASSVGTIPDITKGDFFYYREDLNNPTNNPTGTNEDRPNITFDPRRTNLQGQMSVSTNRVEIQNTDFAMFSDTHLTYVEQNQDVYNKAKSDSYASWIGESKQDKVANNDVGTNGEKDYMMALNFENKDANGVGIVSAVRKVHVKAVGEPTIQDKITEEWDSKDWIKKTVLDEPVTLVAEDSVTPFNPEITLPSFGKFNIASLSTLVSPGYWSPNGSKTVYTDEPWVNQAPLFPNLDVQPDRLTSISGTFKIGTPSGTSAAGNLAVSLQYSNDGGLTWINAGGEQCTHNPCSGSHNWQYSDSSNGSDGYQFNLPAPPAQDGVTQLRVSGTLDGNPFDPNYLCGIITDLQANKETYIDPVYADKTVTRDVVSDGHSMAGYRDGKLIVDINNQIDIPGTNTERNIEYSTDGGATWISLIISPPVGPLSIDLPASITGPVSFRCTTKVTALSSEVNTPAVNNFWDISGLRITAEPIPVQPKTLGLEMTRGYYQGIEQTGNGIIINPISGTEAVYSPTYASQGGLQNFFTDLEGVAGFKMYMNKDEYDILRRKNALVNDATLQVTIDYVEDTNQNGRIEGAEITNIKQKVIGVDDTTRYNMSSNKVLSDVNNNQADTVYRNTLTVGEGRSGGADIKTQNENALTKRLKQVLDSPEFQEVLKFNLFENIYLAATASDNRGDQITGKLILDWDWRRRYIDVNQGSFSAIYKA